MSKYQPLWEYVKGIDTERFQLSFSEIEMITGFPIDHAFLTYRKELLDYGCKVTKISRKEQYVFFERSV